MPKGLFKQVSFVCLLLLILSGGKPDLGATPSPSNNAPASENWFIRILQGKPPWQTPQPRSRSETGSGGSQQIRDRGTPAGIRESQGKLGLCPAIQAGTPSLTALVPTFPIDSVEQPFGLTAIEHPTFWFYVPYSPKSKRRAEFVVIDDQENDVYYKLLELSETPGVVSLSLPPTIPGLKSGKTYRWVFSIVCSQNDRSGDMTVNGWIQRVAPNANLQRQLQQSTTPEQQLAAYAETGVWFDALTIAAELQRDRPTDDTRTYWQALLQSAGLNNLTTAKLSSCCKLDSKPSQSSRLIK